LQLKSGCALIAVLENPTMMARNHNSAEHLIREAGARVTQPRISVLTALLAAPRALTHHEVEQRVRRSLPVDRVTVYRVLEWLVANRLAHRIAGDDRVWRFNAVADEHADEHAHFKCNGCGTVTCLDELVAKPVVKLPAGFRTQRVELTVKGFCAGCRSESRHKPRPRAQHRNQ
jgi:Fur family ferric uptake transcriptional regulator